MSWGYYRKVKCKSCNEEYIQSIDTLSICANHHKECKFCKGELEYLKDKVDSNDFLRQLKDKEIKIISCGQICGYDKNCSECLSSQ